MAIYICAVCDTPYDEDKEGVKFQDLPDDWVCPVCESPKFMFKLTKKRSALAEISVPAKTVELTSDLNDGAPPSAVTVSDLMIRTMINWGVRHVFGMVGHSNLGLADAIRRRCESGDLTFIGIRHEGAASFAASAYAKLVGTPAACLAIAGPGATNLLTGLWDAKLDRVPVLALTGQVDVQVLGPGAFQEIDLAAAFGAVSCWSQTVLNDSNHAELMSLALKNSILRREVAHLIFPNKIQDMPVPPDSKSLGPEGRISPTNISPPAASLEQAVRLIREAERPVIVVGHGSRFSMPSIVRFADLQGQRACF